MISSIIKKATAIYRANSFLLILFCPLFLQAYAQELNSYCFQRSVSLRDAHQSLNLLLLPKDIVEHRPVDNCLDIITSPDRAKLFEKYLSRRYDLKKDPGAGESATSGRETECRLDLKTTKKSNVDSSTFKLGEKNGLKVGNATMDSVSTMEMLLGPGFPSEFEVGNEKLKITCQLVGTDSASLIFGYVEKEMANVSTQMLLKRGEWLNIASVRKELAEKNKTVGIPQTEISQSTGKIETIYELQFK